MCLLGQDLLVPLPLDLQGNLEKYWAWAAEMTRIVEGDMTVAKVVLRAARAHYSMLVRTQDVLCWYQNDCGAFLD